MIYAALTNGRSEEDVLRIDALLGDEAAKAKVEELRVRTAASAGFEVG